METEGSLKTETGFQAACLNGKDGKGSLKINWVLPVCGFQAAFRGQCLSAG